MSLEINQVLIILFHAQVDIRNKFESQITIQKEQQPLEAVLACVSNFVLLGINNFIAYQEPDVNWPIQGCSEVDWNGNFLIRAYFFFGDLLAFKPKNNWMAANYKNILNWMSSRHVFDNHLSLISFSEYQVLKFVLHFYLGLDFNWLSKNFINKSFFFFKQLLWHDLAAYYCCTLNKGHFTSEQS